MVMLPQARCHGNMLNHAPISKTTVSLETLVDMVEQLVQQILRKGKMSQIYYSNSWLRQN